MKKFKCIVCGRVFPQGQGIILKVGDSEYYFHSKSCALKFLRRVLEEVEPSQIKSVFDKIAKEFSEKLREREELRKKVI